MSKFIKKLPEYCPPKPNDKEITEKFKNLYDSMSGTNNSTQSKFLDDDFIKS